SGKFRPYTMVSYDVDCADIVDLRKTDELVRLGLGFDDLGCAWFAIAAAGKTPPSWRIAERLIADGAAGAVYPSFANAADPARHHNLVLWRWTDTPPNLVRVYDPDARLPRN
ncbi:MAG: RES domain-containing protein, partial [Beijerinckiaceae bacterium]